MKKVVHLGVKVFMQRRGLRTICPPICGWNMRCFKPWCIGNTERLHHKDLVATDCPGEDETSMRRMLPWQSFQNPMMAIPDEGLSDYAVLPDG